MWEEYCRARHGALTVANDEAVAANKALLARLKCPRSFKWIHDTLMPGMETFDSDTLIALRLQYGESCLKEGQGMFMILTACVANTAVAHNTRLTKNWELRWHETHCFDWGYKTMSVCHHLQGGQRVMWEGVVPGGNQGRFMNGGGWCMTVDTDLGRVVLEPCSADNHRQLFTWQTVFHQDLLEEGPPL